ncbi:MAG: gamma-glutamyltransferase, partial [Pseudomonadota bacterium]
MGRLVFVIPALFLLLLAGCGGDTRPAAEQKAGEQKGANPRIEAQTGANPAQMAVVAADVRAAEAGMEMLRRGGSAVDAAVAVQAVLGLVEPQSSGLGGGAFMMLWDAEARTVKAFDGREIAPAAAGPDLFLKEDGTPMGFYDAVVGGRSVGVPGVVAMLGETHAQYGKLPWADLFEPALQLAEEGFVVSPRLAGLLTRIPRLKEEPAAAAYFYNDDGTPKAEGTRLTNPAYAKTLRTLMEGGAGAFYEGEIAGAIVDAVTGADNPGGMTLEDVAAYEPVERNPVCGRYRMLKICSMTPPSSGGATLLNILAILENFDLSRYGPTEPEGWKLIMEASRLAYADRALYLADPDKQSGEGAA